MRFIRLFPYTRPLRRKFPSLARDLSPHMRRDIGLGACPVSPQPPRHLHW